MFEERARTRSGDGSRGASNLYGFSDPDLDGLIDRAASQLDPDLRRELLQQAMRRLRDARPYLPVFYPYAFFGHSRRFEWTPRPDGTVRLVDARPVGWGSSD